MTNNEKINLEAVVRRRINICWGGLLFMLIYMIFIGEMGLGDSREMSKSADTVSKIIFFGMIFYIIFKMVGYKKVIKEKSYLLPEYQIQWEKNIKFNLKRNIGVFVLLFITCTAALCNEKIFHISIVVLFIVMILRIRSYYVFKKECA